MITGFDEWFAQEMAAGRMNSKDRDTAARGWNAAPDVTSKNKIRMLEKERDGWRDDAELLAKRLHDTQVDNDLLRKRQSGDTWIWQGDGRDNLESMGHEMVVVIQAKDLRAIAGRAATKPTVWMYKKPEWTNWFYKEWSSDSFGEDADQYVKIALGPVDATHPEASAPGLSDYARTAVLDAVAQALGGAYDCTRVWEAWHVGTMSQDDFVMVAEDENRVAEIADAAIDALTRASAATVGEPSYTNGGQK